MIGLEEFVERLCRLGATAFELEIDDIDLRATVAAYRMGRTPPRPPAVEGRA
jgi:hypothetical protein